MGEAFTFVSHTCLHSDTLLVRASFLFSLFLYSSCVRLQSSGEEEEAEGCHVDSPDVIEESVSTLLYQRRLRANFFPPKK